MERIRSECRQMRWDRPCAPHKSEGVHCRGCLRYDPLKKRVLVIKLDALGDVLRTTCILPAIRQKYPGSQVTWITMAAAIPLLEHNPFIDRVVPYGPDALAVLGVERFDLTLCLDAAPRSAALGSLARAKEKRGFGVDRRGCVVPFTPEAREWLLMGIFDDLKRANRRTYQDIVMGICGLEGLRHEIIVRLTKAEREFARRFAARAGLPSEGSRKGVSVVGMNTGSGSRWRMKQWPVARCAELIRRLSGDGGTRVLLFGGEDEAARNAAIRKAAGPSLVDTGCGNSLREFMSLIGLCDLLVTSDSLGLHAALGLGKKVVGLFGPTSTAEVDVYGRGIKIVPGVDCACCYLRECERTPSCMERLPAETVAAAVDKLLKR
ncbi:MAG: glycosyltransferase family 9 protein [Planctomycetota bacterium]